MQHAGLTSHYGLGPCVGHTVRWREDRRDSHGESVVSPMGFGCRLPAGMTGRSRGRAGASGGAGAEALVGVLARVRPRLAAR